MTTKTAQKFMMRRFDSIHQFVDAAEKGADRTGSGASQRVGDEASWTGTATFEDAVNYAKYGGWSPENMLEFRNMFDKFMPALRKFVESDFERGVDTSGYEVNMQAYLDGEPDNMFQFLPVENMVTKRAVCLIIGHSVSSGCTAEELFVRGQAAIALVRALSLLGFELEIYSEETVGSSYGSKASTLYSVLTRLHAAGELLDETALEFAIGNPSWLRRLLFGLQEGEDEKTRDRYGFGISKGGYGSVKPIQHADLVGADIQLNLGSTWFRDYGSAEDKARHGMQWVVDQLKALGVVDQDAEVEFD